MRLRDMLGAHENGFGLRGHVGNSTNPKRKKDIFNKEVS